MKNTSTLLFWAACTALLLAGCRPSPPAATYSDLLVSVGSAQIRGSDLEAELKRCAARGQIVEPEAALNDLIRRETLLERARQMGLDQDVEVRRAAQNALIAKLKERELEPRLLAVRVSEDESNAVESNRKPAQRPQEIRVAVLQLSFNPKASLQKQEQITERLASAVEAGKRLPVSEGFGSLAVDFSDHQATRYQGGDLGWIEENPNKFPLDPLLLKAAFELREAGEVSPVLHGKDASYVVRLMGRRAQSAAAVKPLKQMADHEAMQKKRAQIEADFEAGVRAAVPVVRHGHIAEKSLKYANSKLSGLDAGPANP